MPATFTYCNPISSPAIDSIRDCQIITDHGRYYLTGSSPPYWDGANPGIKLYVSDDLLHWRFDRFLIERSALPESVWYRDRFWAPEIHRIAGRYWLAFNCRNTVTGHPHSCGLAVADVITGPYRVLTAERPLVEGGNDLSLFCNDDGRVYASWSITARIFAQEIDLSSCTLLGEPVLCVNGRTGAWDELGVEGPWMIRREGTCFLFFSSWSRGYEIGYATAPTPLGPWTVSPASPFFGAQDPAVCERRGVAFTGDPASAFIGVGHNAVFTGPDGRDWLVCHYQAKGRSEELGFDPLVIDGLTISSPGPTAVPMRVPVRAP